MFSGHCLSNVLKVSISAILCCCLSQHKTADFFIATFGSSERCSILLLIKSFFSDIYRITGVFKR